jgi:hypothetical protein
LIDGSNSSPPTPAPLAAAAATAKKDGAAVVSVDEVHSISPADVDP